MPPNGFNHCVLLVFRHHSLKSHRLKFRRSRAEEVAPELIATWARKNKFGRLFSCSASPM